TSSNTRNKNVDTSPRTRNERQTGQFGNQRRVIVAGNRKTIGNQSEWLQDTDDEPDEQELKAHYMYMAKILEVLSASDDNYGHIYDIEPLEKVESYDNYNVFATERKQPVKPEYVNDTYPVEKVDCNVTLVNINNNEREVDQNAKKNEDDLVLLASLIANLKLHVDENKKIKKELKKENTSLTQEPDESKLNLWKCKIELERYQSFQTNKKEKEKGELKCKEPLDLQAWNNEKVWKAKNNSLIAELKQKMLEINDLTSQLQDKSIGNAEIREMLNKMKGKHVKTTFVRPYVVRQLSAFKFQKPPVMGKPTTFANSIKRVYYIEGVNHSLFPVGQFCDADLEVAFRKSTCFVRDLQRNDLLTAKALLTQAWLWRHRLSYLNVDTINLLPKNGIVNGLAKLKYVKEHLCQFSKKEKLNGSNFLDWYRNLRIVLGYEQKLHHLEEALPEAPPATTTVAVRNAYTCSVAEQHEIAYLILASMTPEI
ncbi:hypothetical protein Tco_0425500, partial [Tanacetum coccineum]